MPPRGKNRERVSVFQVFNIDLEKVKQREVLKNTWVDRIVAQLTESRAAFRARVSKELLPQDISPQEELAVKGAMISSNVMEAVQIAELVDATEEMLEATKSYPGLPDEIIKKITSQMEQQQAQNETYKSRLEAVKKIVHPEQPNASRPGPGHR